MTRQLKKSLGIALMVLVTLLPLGASYAGPRLATYEVTITNLTEGQPLTPPVVATHRRPFHIFRVGDAASFELKEIAENGNNVPMITALDGQKHVSDLEQGSMPLVPAIAPGGTLFPDSTTFTITGASGAKYLSFVSMLICTNDGFTGINSMRLPKKTGDSVTVTTNSYDAGTEINTEDFANMVPPCQSLIGVSSLDPGTDMSDPALAEGGVIMHHSGIQGGVDLIPEIHGWTDPVAMVEITRTN